MFKTLDEVCTPKRGTKYSAYVDLFAKEDVIIAAGETKIVKLGVKLDMQTFKTNMILNERLSLASCSSFSKAGDTIWESFLKSHYLEVALRSSLGAKGLIIANGIGIIDLDYPDEIGLIVHNPQNINWFKDDLGEITIGDSSAFIISKGDKVAQCILKEHKGYLMGYETETLRTGGFGSTGIWN